MLENRFLNMASDFLQHALCETNKDGQLLTMPLQKCVHNDSSMLENANCKTRRHAT